MHRPGIARVIGDRIVLDTHLSGDSQRPLVSQEFA